MRGLRLFPVLALGCLTVLTAAFGQTIVGADPNALPNLQASIPAPCASTLLPDTLAGTTGAAMPCAPRADAARPTVIQAAIVTADSTGAWSVTWAKAFVSATPWIKPEPINPSGTQPYICNVAASTTTTANGKCWQTTTMTLPTLASSLLGLVLNPTAAAGGIQVRVAAREPTQ